MEPNGLSFGDSRDGLATVLIGGRDVSVAVVSARTTTKINAAAVADIELDDRAAGLIDYFGLVQLYRGGTDGDGLIFTGTVTSADFDRGRLRLSAQSMPELAESRAAPFTTAGMPPMDLMYMLLRASGLDSAQVRVDDSKERYYEPFEVLQPFTGITLDRALRTADATFLPRSAVTSQMTSGFEAGWVGEALGDCSGVAVGYASESRSFDAELAARRAFAREVAWLQIDRAYGGSHWPDGMRRPYSRVGARAQIRLGSVVLVRGMSSGRRYARVIDVPLDEPPSAALERDAQAPRREVSEQLSQSAQSLALATDANLSPMIRIGAIWEALEYYAAGSSTPSLFTKSELKAIRKSQAALPAPKRDRFESMVAALNQAPLMAKIRRRVTDDGVPISGSEFEHLVRLRRSRNDATHGRGINEPSLADISYGVSIVSRLLVYARHRLDDF